VLTQEAGHRPSGSKAPAGRLAACASRWGPGPGAACRCFSRLRLRLRAFKFRGHGGTSPESVASGALARQGNGTARGRAASATSGGAEVLGGPGRCPGPRGGAPAPGPVCRRGASARGSAYDGPTLAAAKGGGASARTCSAAKCHSMARVDRARSGGPGAPSPSAWLERRNVGLRRSNKQPKSHPFYRWLPTDRPNLRLGSRKGTYCPKWEV
jgi:hypothetical protein